LVTFQENKSSVTGIANWAKESTVGSRYSGLLRFASNYTPASDWRLFSIQLQYILFELRNRYNLTNSKLLAATNIKDASAIINREYLNTDKNTDNYAQVAYDEVIS